MKPVVLITVLASIGLLVLAAALIAAALGTLDLDIPCQDGTWDEARETCIPETGTG